MQTTFDTKIRSTCDFQCLINKSCADLKLCKEYRNIISKVRARHTRSTRTACDIFHIDPPKLDDIKVLFYEKLAGDGMCPYCGCIMDIHATRDYESLKTAYSLDHIISCHSGGTCKKENLQIICHRCNIVKGIVHPDYFATIIKCLTDRYGNEGREKFLNTAYKSLFTAAIREKVESGRSMTFDG